MRKITYETNWKDIPLAELVEIQSVLDKKPSMTVSECAIWLQMSLSGVKKLIKKGEIVTYHPFGSKHVRVDTEATKKNLR